MAEAQAKTKEWTFDWKESFAGGVRHFQSARAVDIIQGYREHKGLDFDRFMRRHAERAGEAYWKLRQAKRGPQEEPDIIGEQQGRIQVWHVNDLSYLDSEGETYRIIAVETCERCLVMEAYDLRLFLQLPRLAAVTLRLWRQAAEAANLLTQIDGPQPQASGAVMRLLLDELERFSIERVLHAQEIDVGKFL